jgi:competence protein ComEC
MRRPLLALAASFGAGCLAADAAPTTGEALVLVGLASVLLGAAVVVRLERAALALGAAAFALGALATEVDARRFESGALRRLLAAERWEGEPGHLVGIVRGDARPRFERLRVTLDLEQIEIRGRRHAIQDRVSVEVGGRTELPALRDGERVALWARLRPADQAEGRRRGIAARGYCKSARLLERRGHGTVGLLRAAATTVRSRLRARLMEAILPGPERGLVLAMVLGDRSELDEETSEAFKASGTYHVLALSGAQVALVAGLIVGGLRRLRAGPTAEALLTSAAVWFYALLVGGDVPIVRAALMASAVLAGRAFDLAADAANLLGLAAFALLVVRPAYAWDVGFQLSFGATLGILLLAGPLGRGLPRLPLRADLAVVASVAAQAVLSPVLALQFHRLAPAAVVLNLAAVPLSAAVLLSGFATLAVSSMPLLGPLVADVAWIAAHALRRSGDLGPLAPWLDVRVAAPTVLVLGVHLSSLVLLVRGGRTRGLALLAVSHVGLLLGPPPVPADGRLHLSVLDVGQGDSLLLRSPSGRALLVDAGGSWNPRYDVGERRIAPVLWRRGIRHFDALILSHAHLDHVGGAAFLLSTFHFTEVWEGPAVPRSPSWRRLDATLRRAVPARRTVFRGVSASWDGVELCVLGPAPPGRPPTRVRNEDSVVLLVRFDEVAFLLAGDVQGDAERALDLPPVLVVKVPHHGGRSSSGPRFVEATRPRLAIVSVAARNPFSYPHPEVVDRYREVGALLLRTDFDGSVEVATDGRRLWVRTAREAVERRIR